MITPVETPSGGQGSMNGGGGYTGEELYLIAQVVRKEGDSESYTAVANVIYNRLHSSRFPSTVNGVIYQKGQFSTSSLKSAKRRGRGCGDIGIYQRQYRTSLRCAVLQKQRQLGS